MPPRIENGDDPERRDESLLSIIPRNKRQAYDAYKILDAVLDRESFFLKSPHTMEDHGLLVWDAKWLPSRGDD